ncbi:hypothetical protein, partial [Clostridium tarantellae]|uniref:hypothetical protein n=1 Tax=Clostridium tarantellae TaxID=39493 RepID=UPI00147832D8
KYKLIIVILLFLTCAFIYKVNYNNEKFSNNTSQPYLKTIEDFFYYYKNGDLENLNTLLIPTLYFKDETKEIFFNKITNLEINDIQEQKVNYTSDKDKVILNVDYNISFNDDFVPIGSLTNGENNVNAIFSLYNNNGTWKIFNIDYFYN